jgi:hypothetical protein
VLVTSIITFATMAVVLASPGRARPGVQDAGGAFAVGLGLVLGHLVEGGIPGASWLAAVALGFVHALAESAVWKRPLLSRALRLPTSFGVVLLARAGDAELLTGHRLLGALAIFGAWSLAKEIAVRHALLLLLAVQGAVVVWVLSGGAGDAADSALLVAAAAGAATPWVLIQPRLAAGRGVLGVLIPALAAMAVHVHGAPSPPPRVLLLLLAAPLSLLALDLRPRGALLRGPPVPRPPSARRDGSRPGGGSAG